ncbi:hypothetical protein HOU00_gp065 [Caulobacter phage CcrPW]|uniref:Uncharacterized protein n=1 Tax=Caulobacter phage CcrPW TaxID=2283271 RepID=A0A385E9S5_9CAUD|nr:hypothetical protein HOU00_gp065 [Caulobacter phage CcrPW]AXQ68604.1 hypothetical protein CcrPW_gp065 [Caulobacter phage CcrPW]
MTAPYTSGRLSMSFTAEDGRVINLSDVHLETTGYVSQTQRPAFGDVAKTIDMTFTAHMVVDPAWKREFLWASHNLIAHPISEITHWLAYIPGLRFLRALGLKLHDITVPRHAPGTGRG